MDFSAVPDWLIDWFACVRLSFPLQGAAPSAIMIPRNPVVVSRNVSLVVSPSSASDDIVSADIAPLLVAIFGMDNDTSSSLASPIPTMTIVELKVSTFFSSSGKKCDCCYWFILSIITNFLPLMIWSE